MILKGAARLQFEDRVVGDEGGDRLVEQLAAHHGHRVQWTSA